MKEQEYCIKQYLEIQNLIIFGKIFFWNRKYFSKFFKIFEWHCVKLGSLQSPIILSQGFKYIISTSFTEDYTIN